MTIKSLVIPVAGMGTRFLPATKTVTKEMLPIIDKPLLHYAIDEAKSAGISSFIFVTNTRNKFPKLYLSQNKKLEEHLTEKGNLEILNIIKSLTIKDKNIKLVYQNKPLGLGDAIYRTKKYIKNKDFAVLLPDDLILGKNCLKELLNVYKKYNSTVVGVMSVDKKDVKNYGIVKGTIKKSKISKITDLVEKPNINKAPSNLAVVGRYILKNSIYDYLKKISKGSGNEIQLTDAIALSAKKENVFSFKFSGDRYDCGSKLGYFKAQVAVALSDSSIRNDVKNELRRVLKKGRSF